MIHAVTPETAHRVGLGKSLTLPQLVYIQSALTMKNLVVSQAVENKLERDHGVNLSEVRQCFLNRKGRLLTDTRAPNRTNPPTLWFIADTNKARALKIVYIQIGLQVHLKTAYEPNDVERAIYSKHGRA